MKKKGFTLVELLGVIVILSIILLISVPAISNILKEYEEQKYESYKNNIYQAAEVYINENVEKFERLKTVGGYEYIYLSELINSDYLKSTVVNPETGTSVSDLITGENDHTVKVTYQEENTPYVYEYLDLKQDIDKSGPQVTFSQNQKTITFTISDYYQLTGYNFSVSNIVEPDFITIPDTDKYSFTSDKTFDEYGIYYLWAKNVNGVVTVTELSVIQLCAFAVNEEFDFSFTGTIEELVITDGCAGDYKLEVWGSRGGNTLVANGGYSAATYEVTSATTLYVVAGGYNTSTSGGYNGGGSGAGSATGGGGATHIATATGLLSSLSSTRDEILIVAGGGAGQANYGSAVRVGGYGAGTLGGTGAVYNGIAGKGGSQTAGGAGYNNASSGYFGHGGTGAAGGYSGGGGGGGGGFYGGGGGSGYGSTTCDSWHCFGSGGQAAGGGGGSGYINPSLTTITFSSNVNSTSGYAKITYLG